MTSTTSVSNGSRASIPIVLTIGGSSPTSGAGIQADIKTFAAHGVYGLSVVTAVTSQNTRGVQNIFPLPATVIQNQIESLVSDIEFRVVKIGMLYSAEVIRFVSKVVGDLGLIAILDTPFSAKDGTALIEPDAIEVFKELLLPIVRVITPNLPESEQLTGLRIASREEMIRAAEVLKEMGAKAVLLKGGHLDGNVAADLLLADSEMMWFEEARIPTLNTHGTGCTLSSAIAANIGTGFPLVEAVRRAKQFITEAITHSIPMGSGSGPLGHFATTVAQTWMTAHPNSPVIE